ncbi:hypothetical protein GCM10023113_23820 [Cellulomonas oligotrophica]|uniref:Uncharacterized protein n=1 Tax=Cellulomonas oligotrophica TaxID=931536 RepID=A0ABQ4D955_9CELL|nr:hypothetical protein Col01nite_14250 [Cellulomonas oligotrophica]
MLSRVQPDGSRLAARLRRLLSDKSVLQYGTYCTRATAERATHDARLLVDALDQRGL